MAGANPLLDPAQWLLAILSGLVGAGIYSAIQHFARLKRWRRLRVARLGDIWKELAWIVVQCRRNGWAPPDLDDQRGLFVAYVRELRAIAAKEDSVVEGIPPERLTEGEARVVGDHIPGVRSMIEPVIEILAMCIADLGAAWDDETLGQLVEVKLALSRFVAWQPPAKFQPANAGAEISLGVGLAHRAMVGLNWLCIIAEDGIGGTIAAHEKKHGTL